MPLRKNKAGGNVVMLLPNTPPASQLCDVYGVHERMFLHLVLAKAMNAISTHHHHILQAKVGFVSPQHD